MKCNVWKSAVFLTFLFFPVMVYAICDSTTQATLTNEANAVEVTYKIFEETSLEDLKKDLHPNNDYVVITIRNITPNLTIHMEDEWGYEDDLYSGINEDITYANTENGVYTYQIESGALRHLNVTVASQTSECNWKQEFVREIVIPGFNSFSLLDECQGSKGYYCQKYTDVEVNLSQSEVIERASKEKKEEVSKSESNRSWSDYKSTFQMFGILLLVMGVIIVVILVIYKKRSNVI